MAHVRGAPSSLGLEAKRVCVGGEVAGCLRSFYQGGIARLGERILYNFILFLQINI